MAQPTLFEVFGDNAGQDTERLFINKGAMASVGLTPSANNSAESMFMAIVLLAARNLTETLRTTDYENRTVTVYSGGADLPVQGGQTYRRDAFSVLAYKPEPVTPLDPDDYA